MNATHQDKRLKMAIFLGFTVCGVLFPVAFYFGIFGVLTLIPAALALQHFIAVLRPRSDVCWGAGTMTRFRMSRLSSFVIGLWLAYITAYMVIRIFLKLPGSPYYLAGHAAFASLVALTRWMDTGRFRV
jgi:hypothetical protein